MFYLYEISDVLFPVFLPSILSHLYIGMSHECYFFFKEITFFIKPLCYFSPCWCKTIDNYLLLCFLLRHSDIPFTISSTEKSSWRSNEWHKQLFWKRKCYKIRQCWRWFCVCSKFLNLAKSCYKFYASYHTNCYCVYPVRLFQVAA